ncbi:tripartite tricarboxylate transporter TctB family protein [Boseongicola sp. H5]|uniref:tripartite tricarboxylate transporter TctB family protein n=1 Tax=Boseongicola sp. H5 TaxID=2763261 RepID=UPI001B137A53|nr:tripartite tricarboxylate transporter TctB family protein [Boseongicola sp. H5]MBO6921952.1 tripartite tricarboxylate transporter TctB family protein [Roseicyclus sp.]
MLRLLDISVSSVLLLAGLGLFTATFGQAFDVPTFGGDVGPAFAPRLFLIVWIALAALALVQAIRAEAPEPVDVNLSQMFAVLIIVCATAYAVTKIGFVLATIPGFAAFCWAFQYRKPMRVLILSIAAPLSIWALFTFGFELLLPRSPWFNQI